MAEWNPSDKNAGITLSGVGNVTAECTSSLDQGVRAIPGHGGGKYYMEFTINAMSTTRNCYFGLATAAYVLDAETFSQAVGLRDSGSQFVNGVGTGASSAGFSTGDRVDMAADLDNKRIWFRTNGGNWNSSPTANPATNVGGGDMSAGAFSWTSLFPFLFLKISTAVGGSVDDKITAEFGDGSFVGTPPAGFSPWSSPLTITATFAVGANELFATPAQPNLNLEPGLPITISWARRNRLAGSAIFVTDDVPMDETVEAYEVDLVRAGAVIRTISGLSTPTCVYTAAMQAADGWTTLPVQLTLRVYQLSSIMGRGFTHEVTVDVAN